MKDDRGEEEEERRILMNIIMYMYLDMLQVWNTAYCHNLIIDNLLCPTHFSTIPL